MSVDADLRQVFKDAVSSAAAGKQLSAQELSVANDKAISKIVKEAMPEMKTKSEASVFPKLCDKTTRKLHIDVFCTTYFLELAKLNVEEKEKRKAALDDPAVKAEADKLKGKVAHLAHVDKGGPAKNAAVVDRLTDTSKYTGAHKERFDESGKGKGMSGRTDEVNTTGYVGQYKGANTYDKTH